MSLAIGRFLTALVLLAGVASAAPKVTDDVTPVSETWSERIEPDFIRPDAGFRFTGSPRLGRPGDGDGRALSNLVLRENGKPLGPAHANHAEIDTLGQGRYSCWAAKVMHFSTSDNSDPRTNGRVYTLESPYQAQRHVTTVHLTDAVSTYAVNASAKLPVRNRRLVLRNLDSRASVTPTLNVQGRPDMSSTKAMVDSVTRPGMTPEQKAIAIWDLVVQWRTHWYPCEDGHEPHDPVKLLNVYGYGFCEDAAQAVYHLAVAAGFKGRVWGLAGHVVAEVSWDNGATWHMFDPDHHVYFRNAGGAIASVEELAANPGLMTVKAATPIGYPSATYAELFTTTKNNVVMPDPPSPPAKHTIQPILEPLDQVTFDLGLAKLVHIAPTPDGPATPSPVSQEQFGRDRSDPPYVAGNGTLVRRLNFSKADRSLLIPIEWPYVLLGGEVTLTLAGSGSPNVSISVDGGKTFTRLPTTLSGKTLSATADLNSFFARPRRAHYACVLKVEGSGELALSKTVTGGSLSAIFQFAPRALQQVNQGVTTFTARVSAPSGTLPKDWAGFEIVHEWDEVTPAAGPAAP